MKYLKYFPLAVVTACALSLLSCSKYKTGGYASGAAVIACDATFQNVLEQEIFVFENNYKNSNVLPLYVDENAVIDSLLNIDNTVRMGVATRPLTEREIAYLGRNKRQVQQQAIAVDAVALIVNSDNPMTFIDYQDLVDILSGKYTTWDKIVPGGASLGEIKVVFDHKGSSTTRYMADSVLHGTPFGPNVYAQKTPAEVFKYVSRHKDAIGIIGVGGLSSDLSGRELSEEEIARINSENDTTAIATFNAENSSVRVLAVQPKDKLESYLPDQFNIYKGNYPFHRQIYLISTCSPNTVGHSFYTFVTSYTGQKIILSTGICPKVITPQFVEL